MAQLLRQLQFFAALQLCQAVAIAVVDNSCTQGRVIVQAFEKGLGRGGRVQGFLAQRRAGDKPAEGVQGLWRHALLGDPVGCADESQIGHQHHGGEQHQQCGEQFAAHWQVFEALTQSHEGIVVASEDGRLARLSGHCLLPV